MTYMRAKIEVASSNRSWDMEGVQNSKSRSRDPFPTALTFDSSLDMRVNPKFQK